MSKSAQIKPWLSGTDLGQWTRAAKQADELRRRLSVWLTFLGYAAREVADWLQVSKQAVWLWVGQYNRYGPAGLERQGRGGRRWGLLSLAKEAELLRGWEDRAQQGEVLTAKQFRPWLAQATGRAVSLAYVYGLLHRRRWRKLGPRPRHLKASVRKQEAFEKLSGHLEPSAEESPAGKTSALALSGRGPFWPHQ
jgi:transposase